MGTHDRLLRPAVLAAGSLLVLSTLLIALWVPSDRAEGFRQRIFYLHVPIALTAYLFLLVGAFYAARYLLRRDPLDDLRSYVAIHQGVILGTLVLISGPIWAKVSWGIWWDWSDKQLNTFLLVFLFYCAYFMLRFSVDEGARRERFSAIYALLGIGMVPLSLARGAPRRDDSPPDRLPPRRRRRWSTRCSSRSSSPGRRSSRSASCSGGSSCAASCSPRASSACSSRLRGETVLP